MISSDDVREEEDVRGADRSYVEIDENIGTLEASEWLEEKCTCSQNCDESCRNRLRRIECSLLTCNSGGRCFNRPWATYQLARVGLEIRQTEGKGFGAFAVEMIYAKTLVREYVGEIIDEKEKKRRDAVSMYLMAYGAGKFIDSSQLRNISRFINHSCDPNCTAEEWYVCGIYRIGIVANKTILPGEEITFNYGSSFSIQECKCRKCQRRPP